MLLANEMASARTASFSDQLASDIWAVVRGNAVLGGHTTTRPDDLVYLAFSNKVELAVRDRLAHLLHARLHPDQYAVREWPLVRPDKQELASRAQSGRRVDFGVAAAQVQGEATGSLLKLDHAFELKSVYSFDIDNQSKRKCDLLKHLAVAICTIGDEVRSIHHRSKRFSLLTVTHIVCEPDAPELQLVMKSYLPRVVEICKVTWDPKERFNPTEKYLEACGKEGLTGTRLICARDCSSNEAIHGVTVSLGYWLYGHD